LGQRNMPVFCEIDISTMDSDCALTD
jgi:hypothetical protein